MTPRSQDLLDRLSREVVLGDGAMGTQLYAKGFPLGSCYDKLNLTDREAVKAVHRSYVVAGAELIETNTFGANPIWLKRFGLEEKAREINLAGARLAREVAGDRIFVAGSIGPLGRKTGEEIPAEAEAGWRLQAASLAEGGADALILETFLDLEELSVAIRAVKAAAPDLPVIASLAMFEKGRTARGVAIDGACRRARELGVEVFGTNCGKGPRHTVDALERLVASGAADDGPALAAFPNAGYPEFVNGRYMYVSTPDYLADAARRLADAGATLIGGCCGTTPADIAAMRVALRKRKRTPAREARLRLEAEGRAPELLGEGERDRKRGKGAALPVVGGAAATPAEAKGARDAGILPPVPPGEHEWLRRARERAQGKPAPPPILVELDPPKDLDIEKGLKGARALLRAGADALTIGDSPLAVMRLSNLAFSLLVQRETGRPVIAHVSCRDRNLIGTQSELMGFSALGVHAVLGITGDPASIGNQPGATSVYDLNSFGLVELMARLNRGENAVGEPLAGRTSFSIGVALNPNGRRVDDQLRRLQKKVQLGAHFVQTQPCFDVGRVRELYERAAPLGVPIYLGILPLTSHRAAEFLHNEVPGIEVPERVRERLKGLDKDGAREEGQRIAREIIDETMDVAHGYYLIPPFNIARNAVDLVAHIRERGSVLVGGGSTPRNAGSAV